MGPAPPWYYALIRYCFTGPPDNHIGDYESGHYALPVAKIAVMADGRQDFVIQETAGLVAD